MTYSQLLPGITNVTERGRYFSFYTWVAWSLDTKFKELDEDGYVEHYRRADCLFTLIAAHDAAELNRDRPAERMIGRLKLLPALRRLEHEESLRLSEYSTRTDGGTRYFKNKMGGLGQYYLGPLTELGLCQRRSSGAWVEFTKLLGGGLAETVEKELPAEAFWSAVTQDVVTPATLSGLKMFAPRQLVFGSQEHEFLLKLLVGRGESAALSEDKTDRLERRKTLGLILHLARVIESMEEESLHEWIFRPSVYSGTLPGGTPWNVPALLHETRVHWAIYERNDLLSVACQTVLAACLRTIEEQAGKGIYYATVEAFASAYSVSHELKADLDRLHAATFGELSERVRQDGPALSQFEDPHHEFQIEDKIYNQWGNGSSPSHFLAQALLLLGTLAARGHEFPDGYGELAVAGSQLSPYPINLLSFGAKVLKWHTETLASTVRDVIAWVLNTHLAVALRKLSQTRASSFHLRPTEYGLQVVGAIPQPARTLPRLTQAMRILEDLGALREMGSEHLVKLTPLGNQILEEILA